MKKLNKTMILLLVFTLMISTVSISFAEAFNEGDIKTGFYIKDADGENIFIDIYTFLNDKEDYLPIINAGKGIGNVLFVNQYKKGANLKDFLEEANFRELEYGDFEENYKDGRTDEALKPKDAFYSLSAQLDKKEYLIDEEITLTGQTLALDKALGEVDITIKIEDKDEVTVLTEQLETDEDGKYIFISLLPEDLEVGTYTVIVAASEPVNKSVELTFKIVEEETIVDDEIPQVIIERIAREIKGIFDEIDESDKASIIEAKSNIADISDEAWDTVLVDILTDELVAKFDDEADAKEKLQAAIEELAVISYSVESKDLESSLMAYAETHLPTFRAIFGDQESARDIFGFIEAIISNIPDAILPSQGNALVGASNEELIGIIEDVAKTTIYYTLDEYEEFRGKLGQVDLSIDTLLGVRGKLADEIDKDNAAQIALINAYARRQASIDPISKVEVAGTIEYILSVLGQDVSTLVNWSSSNEEVATVDVDEKVVLTGLSAGTTTITAYRGNDESNWIVQFEVEVVEKLEIESVSATNGQVTIKFTKEIPGEDHGLISEKLKLFLSNNENSLEEIAITGLENRKSDTFVIEVPEIAATEEEQRLVYSAQLGDADPVFAEVVIISATEEEEEEEEEEPVIP